MSEQKQLSLVKAPPKHERGTDSPDVQVHNTCPICGARVQDTEIGNKAGWTCLTGGYAHYYQARYGHLEQWFTSGEGNLREPVIQAMNCAA